VGAGRDRKRERGGESERKEALETRIAACPVPGFVSFLRWCARTIKPTSVVNRRSVGDGAFMQADEAQATILP